MYLVCGGMCDMIGLLCVMMGIKWRIVTEGCVWNCLFLCAFWLLHRCG